LSSIQGSRSPDFSEIAKYSRNYNGRKRR